MKFLEARNQVIYNGKPAIALGKPGTKTERSARIFCPPTPKPIGLGVGQYKDKVIGIARPSQDWLGIISINEDPSSYVDYSAWMDAFHKAYSGS